jgi:diamine N-acetyltransferase
VVKEHALTEELVATNAAFTTADKLRPYLKRPVALYGLCARDVLIGCVAIRQAKGNTRDFSIERLTVSPQYRHRGHGGRLLSHACESIRKEGGTRALLGLMDTNKVLKEWSKSKGFRQIECRTFSCLPFKACSMCKDLNAGR